jgi:hypothetical protein
MARGAATALFFIVNPFFLVIYMAVDYGLYFMYMAARKDIVFYLPMTPTTSWIISPIFKIMFKVVGDFSGSPVVRVPLTLGGSYYIFCLISAQVSVLVAVHMYNLVMEEREGKIAAVTLWRLAALLVGLWCVAMTFFLTRVVTPSHRHTFWSLVSGRQCCQEYFTMGATDEDKLEIFGCNRLLWESKIGSEVIEFTLQNWARWKRDKPSWFTARVISTVPDEYIPSDHLVQLGGANRIRRGSAASSVRESFRMIEDIGKVEKDVEVIEEVIEENTTAEIIEEVGFINEEKDATMEEGVEDIMNGID